MRTLAALGLALVLGACAPARTLRAPDAGDAAALRARVAELAPYTTWAFEGRVAVSDGNDGGSGRIQWRQRGADYTVTLRTPVSNATWRLECGPGECVLHGDAAGPRRAVGPEGLLDEALGWRLPVEAVARWVRGLPLDPAAARVVLDAEGRPARLREGGWTVRFPDYLEPGPGRPALPRKVYAERGDTSVRLALARWDLDASR